MAEWLAVISITFLAVISPGADFAMVSRNALTLSRRGGVLTAIGIGMGVLVHVTYTLIGIGVLIRETPALFDLLKLIGAAYLVWLGISMLRKASPATPADVPEAPLTDLAAIWVGFLTNVLNPKTTIFIVSLFMQVVQDTTPLGVRVAYGLFIALAHVTWFAAVGLFLGTPRVQRSILGAKHLVDRVFGLLLIGFGALLGLGDLGG